MCETFPPNQQEDCNIPRASIKVGWENRLLMNDKDTNIIDSFSHSRQSNLHSGQLNQ